LDTTKAATEFSLTVILGVRRKLTAQEVLFLLAKLPRLLDNLDNSTCVGNLLSDVLVVFSGDLIGADSLLSRELSLWPKFNLVLSANRSGTTTTPRQSQLSRDLPTRLAALIYELLGGSLHVRAAGKFQYIPISGIGESANLTLKEMLLTGDYPTCEALWRRWVRKVEVRWKEWAAVEVYIPKWALKMGRPATVLDLAPQTRRRTVLRFVARDEFRIGRSLPMADLSLEVKSRRERIDDTKHLSRVHVLGRRTEEGICFLDGDGAKASVNGSALGGNLLDAETGRALHGPAELALAPRACDCRLGVEPLSCPVSRSLVIANLADWHGAASAEEATPNPVDAIAFRAVGNSRFARAAVWLFSGVGFRMAPDGVLEVRADGTPEFLLCYFHGCFWLACLREPVERVSADDAILPPGHIMPVDEQLLDFGQQRFSCRLASD
jgi:hypothetical protein